MRSVAGGGRTIHRDGLIDRTPPWGVGIPGLGLSVPRATIELTL
ncbi:hypothetical protein AB0G42_32215 [Streptomyces yangpuensis]